MDEVSCQEIAELDLQDDQIYGPTNKIMVMMLRGHIDAEANYTIHTFPQESAKCGDKIKAYISCFHLQLNPSFPFFRDI